MKTINLKLSGIFFAFMVTVVLIGCAGGGAIKKTEPGYTPTHIAIGELIAYTSGVSTVNYDDLLRMARQQLDKAITGQSLRYIKERELETMQTIADKTVLLDIELSFQSGMRSMTGGESYNVVMNYKLRRRSDNLIWLDGSARSTDEAVSQSATLDLSRAVEFASVAVAKEIKQAIGK